jgi:formylmethanofuran dehydrogenase subunit E-like metal-binding protein
MSKYLYLIYLVNFTVSNEQHYYWLDKIINRRKHDSKYYLLILTVLSNLQGTESTEIIQQLHDVIGSGWGNG